jgi:protein phosphatase
MRSAGVTDQGRIRQNNEDAFVADDALGLYAVSDGVGGLDAGEVASRMVIDALAEAASGLRSRKDDTPAHGVARNEPREVRALRSAVTLANRRIFEKARSGPARGGMGATATAVVIRESTAYLAHVGDSRAYRLRSKAFEQLTADHSLVAEEVRAGRLTPEEARRSPHRNVITRAVGIDREVEVDVAALPMSPGDRFLLCTDGLTDMLTDAEIAAILGRMTPVAAAQALVDVANVRGGRDNITAVVVEIAATER